MAPNTEDTTSPISTENDHATKPRNYAVPNVIPPHHRHRTLVLCFDGTGDQFDLDNSNVVRFFSLLKKDDSQNQLVYYQAGIGTTSAHRFVTPLTRVIARIMDESIAYNLNRHVMEGYEFLMQNYTVGDKISIFGFSRGAYIARSLAGMIHKVGILPRCNHQQVPFAWKMFIDDTELGWTQSTAFKDAFSIDAEIEFIGVWDTVNSVGFIPRRLPFTASNAIVRTFRHAIALDEHRAKFRANMWQLPTALQQGFSQSAHKRRQQHSEDDSDRKSLLEEHERIFSEDVNRLTDVEEVWFAGAHCDVGGGAVPNSTSHSLAGIPLRWMIRECFKARTGIMFETERLQELGIDPTSLWPEVAPRPPALPLGDGCIRRIPKQPRGSKSKMHMRHAGQADPALANLSEEERELQDALAPIYDQLSLKWHWWILELLPSKLKTQLSEGDGYRKHLGLHLGRGRFVPMQKAPEGVKVHRSVKLRLDALHEDGKQYIPKALFDKERTTWVD